MKRALLALGALALFSLAGCAGERAADTEAASGADEGALREFSGTELSSSDGLKIKIEMLDGTKRHTKNRRFIKAKFTRGSKSVVMWCDSMVTAAKNQPVVSSVRCSKGVTTVSNDDDESLSFDIVRKDDSVEGVISYGGDGTFLGDDFAVLAGRRAQGGDEANVPLTISSSVDNIDKNPLVLLDRVASAAKSMLGKTVHIQEEDVDARVKITSLDALVSDAMVVSFIPRYSSVHLSRHDDDASLLRTAGNLDSGIVTEATLKDRFKSALKVE